jgi:hypothetical protein
VFQVERHKIERDPHDGAQQRSVARTVTQRRTPPQRLTPREREVLAYLRG